MNTAMAFRQLVHWQQRHLHLHKRERAANCNKIRACQSTDFLNALRQLRPQKEFGCCLLVRRPTCSRCTASCRAAHSSPADRRLHCALPTPLRLSCILRRKEMALTRCSDAPCRLKHTWLCTASGSLLASPSQGGLPTSRAAAPASSWPSSRPSNTATSSRGTAVVLGGKLHTPVSASR